MNKQPHCLLEFIIVLDEKANKSNKFCVCQECVIGSSYENAYNNKFANTKELVRHHLKNCIYFKQKYSESEQAEILVKSDKVVSTTNNSFQESINNNSATESEVSLPLSKDQQKHFEQLSLKATVSYSLAFFWIENPEIKVLIEFLYPPVKLPSQKKLGGQILAEYAQNITKSIKEIAQSDKNCVTLAYDCWKNIKKELIFKSVLITSKGKILVWSAEDILNECMKWPDVLLEPYMALLNKLQQDKDCLTEVLHSFGWIVHYYKSWFGKPPHSILHELQHYESEEYPFDKETFDQYSGNMLNYWSFCKEIAVELHLVA
ncbi:13985_t:CDS:2, partial [Cetraspora pellucida]